MEEKELKERMGKLGLYLVDKARDLIKDMNQNYLSNKAEEKLKTLDRINENSLKLKDQFIEMYNKLLNSSLTSNLMNANERLRKLKNALIEDLKTELMKLIKVRIKDDYDKYVSFLINKLESIKKFIDQPPNLILHFNLEDYDYFSHHLDKIESIFNNPIILKSEKTPIIGGFRAVSSNGRVVFDLTIDNFIEKRYTLIQKEFSEIISDQEIKELQNEFERVIKNKRKNIEEYLNHYERI